MGFSFLIPSDDPGLLGASVPAGTSFVHNNSELVFQGEQQLKQKMCSRDRKTQIKAIATSHRAHSLPSPCRQAVTPREGMMRYFSAIALYHPDGLGT